MAYYWGEIKMRHACMRVLALAVVTLTMSVSTAATTLEITTFNIRWFGSDNKVGPDPMILNNLRPFEDEKRVQAVRDFLANVVQPRDVIVFNEVVDKQLLKKILPRSWECISYEAGSEEHQYVVVCASPQYQFVPVSYDNDPIIEEVALGNARLRPAVRVDLADRSGKRLLRIVAVHLKAMPEETEKRVQQAHFIAKDLSNAKPVPTIILGDMNTYFPEKTGLPRSDVELIEKELDQFDKSFTFLKHSSPFTFRSKEFRSQFDQIYVNGQVRVTKGPDVFPVCSSTKNGTGYMNFEFYYEFVSDHCPVKVQVEVP